MITNETLNGVLPFNNHNHPFSLVKLKQTYYYFQFCKSNEFFDERRSAAFYPASQQRAPIKIRERRSGSAWSHKLYIFFVLIPEGKRHDAWMLGESHLLNDLERFAFSTGGQPMCIYGDPVYPVRVTCSHLIKGTGLCPRGGGTLGISGWGCAAGTLEPLTYTRASSAEFCYPILE